MGVGGGNDGGSLANERQYIVKEKRRVRKTGEDHVRRQWTTCAISAEPLRDPVRSSLAPAPPRRAHPQGEVRCAPFTLFSVWTVLPQVVACEVGFLYNKEAVLEHLLSGKELVPFRHLKSLKRDLTELHLSWSDAESRRLAAAAAAAAAGGGGGADARVDEGEGEDDPATEDAENSGDGGGVGGGGGGGGSTFLCPISRREANGTIPFVFLRSCGHAMAREALAMATDGRCPVCGLAFEREEDVVRINPPPEERDEARLRLEARRAASKAKGGAGRTAESRKRGIDATVEGPAAAPVPVHEHLTPASSPSVESKSEPTRSLAYAGAGGGADAESSSKRARADEPSPGARIAADSDATTAAAPTAPGPAPAAPTSVAPVARRVFPSLAGRVVVLGSTSGSSVGSTSSSSSALSSSSSSPGALPRSSATAGRVGVSGLASGGPSFPVAPSSSPVSATPSPSPSPTAAIPSGPSSALPRVAPVTSVVSAASSTIQAALARVEEAAARSKVFSGLLGRSETGASGGGRRP